MSTKFSPQQPSFDPVARAAVLTNHAPPSIEQFKRKLVSVTNFERRFKLFNKSLTLSLLHLAGCRSVPIALARFLPFGLTPSNGRKINANN